ncbi:MAG: hypothetical protein M1817_005936 [Caeruleum heppii]|nr:MAG: hypothetical protein M1817_005936 [Caeruleum heppii]
MNGTIPIHIPPLALTTDWHALTRQLADEVPTAVAGLLLPTALLYVSIYAHVRGFLNLYKLLTFTSIACFWACPWLTPIHCGPLRCLQNLAIAIGTMKMLDIFARRQELPEYTASKRRPAPWLFAAIALTELRYESFTPNHIRLAGGRQRFSEPLELAIHAGAFAVLQALPQKYAAVLAVETLIAIYIIWTSMQLLLRYKSSPPLFGPLYLADSLSGFWSETWHNAFSSPCESLLYRPARRYLPRYGVPVVLARSIGILGAFALMAIFHMYTLQPILPRKSLRRIGYFFVLNGLGTVLEGAFWGRRRHWLKTLLAWVFELMVSTWTIKALHIPQGLNQVPWADMCGPVDDF